MNRYYSKGLTLAEKDGEYYIIQDGSGYNPQPVVVAKLAAEQTDRIVLVKRGDDYYESRISAGDFEFRLGVEEDDNWMRPNYGGQDIRVTWAQVQQLTRSLKEAKDFETGLKYGRDEDHHTDADLADPSIFDTTFKPNKKDFKSGGWVKRPDAMPASVTINMVPNPNPDSLSDMVNQAMNRVTKGKA